MAKQYPLVVVTWKDAKADSRWQSLKDAEQNQLAEIRTTGWLIYTNKERVVLASEMGDEKDCAHRHIIPRSWIVRMERQKGEHHASS